MALQFQLSNAPSESDFAFFNYSGSDIPAFVSVQADAVNVVGTNPNEGIGIVPVAVTGNVVIGVTMEVIKAGSYGRVRCFGPIAQTFADGVVTANGIVDGSATASRIGFAKAHAAGKNQLGIALSTAADQDPVLVMLVGGFNA
jgi:hypothetical protein